MKPEAAYEWLRRHDVEASYLSSVASLTAWDQRTYLPPRGHPHRAEQLALMARLLHERSIDPRIGERLADIEGTALTAYPVSTAAVNVREWRREFDRATRIPVRLAEDLARTTSKCETLWEEARRENDWESFAPHLARVVELTLEKADALGYEDEAYDALLDEYEPGERATSLELIFGALRDPLVSLIDRVRGSSRVPDSSLLSQPVPVAAQERFSRRVAADIGYDLEAGRIDTTAHPFTIDIGPGDVRITTRYAEDFFPAALFGTIHEAGHAMYEQGLPEEHWGTPRGRVTSLGIHESQSRLWENLVGRSAGFWHRYQSIGAEEIPSLDGVDLDALLLAINAVAPSLIRVEADEITYNLHILVRFELELALTRREIDVDDLPEAWREKMDTYLGVRPEKVADGAMQDVHWAAGLIGYFPTYTLGNLCAAQLFCAASTELGDLEQRFAAGEFAPLLGWLRDKVHSLGSTYPPRDLIRHATGAELDPAHFVDHVERKYTALYDL